MYDVSQLSNAFHKFSFLTCFTSLPVFVMYGCFTFGNEGGRVMSVDSFTGYRALSGLFAGVMLTVPSGNVHDCDG